MANKPEIIQVPNPLKNKVTYGPGGVDPAALERAEAVIADLKGDYLTWVQEDLQKLQAAYDKAAAASEGDRTKAMQDVFGVAHDIKGQGGSFGYQLVTVIGNQLCRFIEKREQYGIQEVEAVRLHIDAMRLVINKRMEGDGGRVGANLVAGLSAVLDKLSK